MGIKEQRDNRRKSVCSQFVSVEDLIAALAKDEGIDISEVAAALLAELEQTSDETRPHYGFVDTLSWQFVAYEVQVQKDHLDDILHCIAWDNRFCDDVDHHGWMRDELFPFLQKAGIPFPELIPDWIERDADVGIKKDQEHPHDPEGSNNEIAPVTCKPKKARRAPTDIFITRLTKLLDEIDERVRGKGMVFDRKAMPGRCSNLHDLAMNTSKFSKYAFTTFQKYQKESGLCNFKNNARDSDFYIKLFPERFK